MPTVNVKGYGNVNFPNGMDVNDIRDSLRRRYSDQTNSDLLQSASKYAAPTGNVAAPYEPSLMEKAATNISKGLYNSGIVSNKPGAYQIGKNVTAIGELLPGVGDVAAIDDFSRAAASGDNLGMGLAALGVIPVVGDLAKKGVKRLDDFITVTHGSNDPKFTGEIKKGGLGNIFDGVFASVGDASEYGGKKQIQYKVDKNKLMSSGDSDVDYDSAISFIKEEYPGADEETVDALYEVIAEERNIFDMSVNPLEDFGFNDLGEASWEGQRLRGKLAVKQGFDAVEMDDEFGTSILVPFGSKAEIINKSAIKL
jgi:hypothetical protein